mgnify:CR=1 FL=1|jgi:ATP-dependent DNA ligase
MKDIVKLKPLYKRDTKGKVRVWEVEYGETDIAGSNRHYSAGTRTISGIVDGKKVTSGWNMSEPKNIGKVNETTSLSQAMSEAHSLWDIKAEKEYFEDISKVDTYEKFKPMLAHDYTKRPQSEGYSQPKLDGIRCVADKNGLWTRSGKAITSCPHIWESVKPFIEANPNIILDGELYNHELKANFNKITSLVRKVKSTPEDMAEAAKLVQYHVYDCYIADTLFTDRIAAVKSLASDIVHIVETDHALTQDELDALYSDYMERGYEGQMVRNNTPYENKRSKNLLKRKQFITEEFDVVEMLEGKGNWSGYTKRFVLTMKNGTEFGSGVRGNQAQLKELWESGKNPTWATCRYFELTPDGVPRFPVVIDYGYGARED